MSPCLRGEMSRNADETATTPRSSQPQHRLRDQPRATCGRCGTCRSRFIPGRPSALVGESGCGKSVTAMSILRLIPSPPGKVLGGRIVFEGRDLLTLSEREMRGVRGKDDRDDLPGADDVASTRSTRSATRSSRRSRCTSTSTRAGVRDRRAGAARSRHRRRRAGGSHEYPHQMSGGMRQRVMIAMAPVVPAEAADRRRADDGAGRDDPGADPRAAAQAPARARACRSCSSRTTWASSRRTPTWWR